MGDNPKAAWPKTPDGTTDWEVVFEDPDTGFIPLISQAQSPDALKMGATVIIEKLFTRKNDADDRSILIAKLTGIIAGGGPVESMTVQVTLLLRSIKEERIEKARAYVERKRAGAAIDRRAGLLWKIDKLLEPKVLIPFGAVLVFALAGLVYFALHSALGPSADLAAQPPARKLPAEPAARGAQEQASLPPTDTEPPALDPIPIWFQTIRWPVPTKYSTSHARYYSVTLYVMNWDHKTEICRRLPKVMDRFYQSFNDYVPTNRNARERELRAVEQDIQEVINAILPGDFVVDAAVARYGTREFTIASRPPYCKSPNVRQPKPAAED